MSELTPNTAPQAELQQPLHESRESQPGSEGVSEATASNMGAAVVQKEVLPASESDLDVDPYAYLESSSGQVKLGLLSAEEFRSRRSNTLLQNPEAKLDEEQEIKNYFDTQDSAYLEQITSLANIENVPMKPACRAAVTIVAFGEGSRIKNTLEQYTNQDIDPNFFEIVVLDNHPEAMPDDGTSSEVAKFKEEHPEITVTFAHKVWGEGEPATVGNARKYAFDIAQARILNRGSNGKDTILVSNDADVLGFESNYLSSIITEFDSNVGVDALVTRMGLPPEAMAKPNLAAAVSLWDVLDRTIAKDEVGLEEERIPEPASLIGRSSAMRASIYAAVGGYNPEATLAEDTELGWMIGDARDWNADSIVQFDETSLTTDPRRYLVAIANRVPLSEMFSDFQQRPEIRQMNNNEIIGVIPDTFDWEQFQADADSFWQSQDTGMYKRLGQRFEPLFKSAMANLGVQYEIVDSSLVLSNVDDLLKSLSGGQSKIEVVHSQPRTVEPDAIRGIKQFFSGIPNGVLGAWGNKANRISNNIRMAQERGEQDMLPALLREYKHYAGSEYGAAA